MGHTAAAQSNVPVGEHCHTVTDIPDNKHSTDIYVGPLQTATRQRGLEPVTRQHTPIRVSAWGPLLLVDCRGRVARCCTFVHFAHLQDDVEPVRDLAQPNAEGLL